MAFEEQARAAGRLAREIGARADRPDLLRFQAARRTRRILVAGILVVVALGIGIVLAPDGGTSVVAADTSTTSISATTSTTLESGECQITLPSGEFRPPGDFGARPPDLYESLWYGEPSLWTMLPPEGAIWSDLPQNTPGLFTNKVFWWADGYDAINDPPAVVVVARNDEGDVFEFSGRDVTSGMRPDIGRFMIAGVELPVGCWALTGTYGDTSLTFTVEIIG